MASTVRKATLSIKGRVQGVFYRQSARETARSFGLGGWVRNMPDGTVQAEIVGPPEAVERMIEWCRKGPPSARVESVDVTWHDVGEEAQPDGFEIRGGW